MSYLDGYLARNEVFYVCLKLNEGFYFSEDTLDTVTEILYDMNEKGYFLLFGFSILPWEIHIIIRPDKVKNLEKILRGIKRRVGIGRKKVTSSLWQENPIRKNITTRDELLSVLQYIHKLPVVSGLVKDERDYRYASSYPGNITDLDTLW